MLPIDALPELIGLISSPKNDFPVDLISLQLILFISVIFLFSSNTTILPDIALPGIILSNDCITIGFNSIPPIVSDPAIFTFSPVQVIAVMFDELDLITNSPQLFVNLPKLIPFSLRTISEFLLSKTMLFDFILIFSSETIFNVLSIVPLIYDFELANCNCLESFNKIPLFGTCVNVTSLLFPNTILEFVDKNKLDHFIKELPNEVKLLDPGDNEFLSRIIFLDLFVKKDIVSSLSKSILVLSLVPILIFSDRIDFILV